MCCKKYLADSQLVAGAIEVAGFRLQQVGARQWMVIEHYKNAYRRLQGSVPPINQAGIF